MSKTAPAPAGRLSNGAVLSLSQMLQAKGWSDSRRDIHLAGALLCQWEPVEEELAARSRKAQATDRSTPEGIAEFYRLDDDLKAWLKASASWSRQLSDAEHNVCRKAVEAYIAAKNSPSRYLTEILELLKLTE